MERKKGYTSVGLVGLTATVIFGLAWVFAVMEAPSWVFGENMLSDLGVFDTVSAVCFNGGCLIGGMLIMVSGIGIASLRMRMYGVSGVSVAFAGLFLALIGIFPSDTGYIHNYFAVGLFILGLFAMIFMMVGDWLHHHVLFGGVTIMMVVVIAVTFMTESLAYFEGFTVIAFLFWFAMSCIKISFVKEKW